MKFLPQFGRFLREIFADARHPLPCQGLVGGQRRPRPSIYRYPHTRPPALIHVPSPHSSART
ncbi:MAG: hypothetical protein Q4A03_03835 [Rothia sp. (in: high G+C Gram-positive bacteria)]|nr:hypothetical protein [Rothia sp. (in: high G+C Gram-positive bacteria)]